MISDATNGIRFLRLAWKIPLLTIDIPFDCQRASNHEFFGGEEGKTHQAFRSRLIAHVIDAQIRTAVA